jgi:hypothetical protein
LLENISEKISGKNFLMALRPPTQSMSGLDSVEKWAGKLPFFSNAYRARESVVYGFVREQKLSY